MIDGTGWPRLQSFVENCHMISHKPASRRTSTVTCSCSQTPVCVTHSDSDLCMHDVGSFLFAVLFSRRLVLPEFQLVLVGEFEIEFPTPHDHSRSVACVVKMSVSVSVPSALLFSTCSPFLPSFLFLLTSLFPCCLSFSFWFKRWFKLKLRLRAYFACLHDSVGLFCNRMGDVPEQTRCWEHLSTVHSVWTNRRRRVPHRWMLVLRARRCAET